MAVSPCDSSCLKLRPVSRLMTLVLAALGSGISGCSLIVGGPPDVLPVAALWSGEPIDTDSWNLEHHEGLCAATATLPYVVDVFEDPQNRRQKYHLCNRWLGATYVGLKEKEKIRETAELAIQKGAKVIILNSLLQRDAALQLAGEHPDTYFLLAAGLLPDSARQTPNVGAFYTRMEQVYYVTGFVAGKTTRTGRLGVIGSVPSPVIARQITAYTRGAQEAYGEQATPLRVELRWLGSFKDTGETEGKGYEYLASFMPPEKAERLRGEEYLAAQLIDAGCDVLIHMTDTNRVQRKVAEWQRSYKFPPDNLKNPNIAKVSTVYTIGNDSAHGCQYYDAATQSWQDIQYCIGTTQVHWSTMYSYMLSMIMKGEWRPNNWVWPLSPMELVSIGEYHRQPVPPSLRDHGVDDSTLGEKEQEYSGEAGAKKVFRPPIAISGDQPTNLDPKNGSAFTFPDERWFKSCWLIKGVVERKHSSTYRSFEDLLSNPVQEAVVPMGEHLSKEEGRVLLPSYLPDGLHDCSKLQ